MRAVWVCFSVILLWGSSALGGHKEDTLTRSYISASMVEGGETVEFDPSSVSGIYIWNTILDDLFEPLIYMTSEGDFIPGGAQKWWYSEDGMSLFVELKPGRLWSDGTPITAQDYVFTLERMRDPEFATAPPGFITSTIAGFALESDRPFGVVAEAPDRLRIDVTSEYGISQTMLSQAAFMPLPRHVAPETRSSWSTWPARVSNGAYRLKEVSGNRILIERNPHAPTYLKPHFDFVEVKLQSWKDAAKAFLDGEVDTLYRIPERQLGWFVQNDVDTFNVSASTFFLAMNPTIPKLKDPRVRRALRLAVDRENLVGQLYRGWGRAAYSIIPKHVADYQPDPSLIITDLDATFEEARALMRAAGYGPNNPLQVTLSSNFMPQYKNVADFLKFGWSKIYVDLQFDFKETEFEVWFKRFTEGDYEIGRRTWYSSVPRIDAFMDVCRPLKDPRCGYYDNPEYKKIMDRAYAEPDITIRRALFQEADRMLTEADVLIPISHNLVPLAINKRIYTDDFGDQVRKFRSADFQLRPGQ